MGAYLFLSHVRLTEVSLYNNLISTHTYTSGSNINRDVVPVPDQRGCTSGYASYLVTSLVQLSCISKGGFIPPY